MSARRSNRSVRSDYRSARFRAWVFCTRPTRVLIGRRVPFRVSPRRAQVLGDAFVRCAAVQHQFNGMPSKLNASIGFIANDLRTIKTTSLRNGAGVVLQ